jgi:hypothetical protein
MPSICNECGCGALASASRRRFVERGKIACLGAVERALALLWGDVEAESAEGRMGLPSRHWPMAASMPSATSWGGGARLHRLRHERE